MYKLGQWVKNKLQNPSGLTSIKYKTSYCIYSSVKIFVLWVGVALYSHCHRPLKWLPGIPLYMAAHFKGIKFLSIIKYSST